MDTSFTVRLNLQISQTTLLILDDFSMSLDTTSFPGEALNKLGDMGCATVQGTFFHIPRS